MKCCNGDCQKEIKHGQFYIGSKYGDFCSKECWMETVEWVVGYDPSIRDVEKEKREEEEFRKRSEAFKNRPKWGDDL